MTSTRCRQCSQFFLLLFFSFHPCVEVGKTGFTACTGCVKG
jgi:hypothetical protein